MGGIGIALILIAIFIGIIAIRGTYKQLPPWTNVKGL